MRTPELPPDVWSHVASFLPVKDAARLSGVCRDASRLQIENAFLIPLPSSDDDGKAIIEYTNLIPAEGFLWASRRWASAKVLHLRLHYSHASRVEWMSSMTHAAASLSRLEKLLLDCSHEIDGDWARMHSGPLLSNIIQHAQRLRVLQVHCHTFSLPTQLNCLQHLELTLGGAAADIDLSTLALAPNLVTLHVENDRLVRELRTLPEHLDFSPLSRLRAVRQHS